MVRQFDEVREALTVKADAIRQEILGEFKSLHEELDKRQKTLFWELDMVVLDVLRVISSIEAKSFEGSPVVDLNSMSFKRYTTPFVGSSGFNQARLVRDITSYGSIERPQVLPCRIEVVECTVLDQWKRTANLICKAYQANGVQFLITTQSQWKFELDCADGVVEPSVESWQMNLSVKVPRSAATSTVRIRVSYDGVYFKDDLVIEFEPIQDLRIEKIGDGGLYNGFCVSGDEMFLVSQGKVQVRAMNKKGGELLRGWKLPEHHVSEVRIAASSSSSAASVTLRSNREEEEEQKIASSTVARIFICGNGYLDSFDSQTGELLASFEDHVRFQCPGRIFCNEGLVYISKKKWLVQDESLQQREVGLTIVDEQGNLIAEYTRDQLPATDLQFNKDGILFAEGVACGVAMGQKSAVCGRVKLESGRTTYATLWGDFLAVVWSSWGDWTPVLQIYDISSSATTPILETTLDGSRIAGQLQITDSGYLCVLNRSVDVYDLQWGGVKSSRLLLYKTLRDTWSQSPHFDVRYVTSEITSFLSQKAQQ
eukprot:TRINITY_DN4611_c0_g1_i1.p1 TRINITY_DN4611_c0_g1~~TRINITY_DN4611_c0_g1_i1.p1  ORF type:complete len:540 (+),score=115.79 TRINITY_DN4611_c0_g1_i1:29-1648(+)